MLGVLVIDDNESMRRKLVALLDGLGGFSIDQAHDQETARKLMAEKTYQLALVDIELSSDASGKYAGLPLLQELSGQGCTSIVISGTAEDNLKSITYSLTSYDFIAKPINDQELISTVQHAVQYIESNKTRRPFNGLPEGITIDPTTKKFVWNKKLLTLTLTERTILSLLLESPDQVVDNKALCKATKSASSVVTHLSNIRQKFRDADKDFDRIHPEPGKGYVWKSSSGKV